MINQMKKTFKLMYKYIPLQSTFSLVLEIAYALFPAIILFFSQQLINNVEPFINGSLNASSIIFWVVLLVLVMFIRQSKPPIKVILIISARRKLNKTFSKDILEKFKKLDYFCFEDSKTQDLISRMGDNYHEKYWDALTNFQQVIAQAIGLIGMSLILMQVSVWAFLGYLLVVLIISIINYQKIKVKMSLWHDQSIEARKSDYYSKLLNEKHSLYELTLFNSLDYIRNKWISNENKMLKSQMKNNIKAEKYSIISGLVMIFFMFGLFYLLFNGVINKTFSVGVLFAVVGALVQILNNGNTFAWMISRLGEEAKKLEYFNNFMDLPEFICNQNEGEKKIKNLEIEFKDVVFSYPKTDKKILDGVSFKVNSNEKIALVGENGAGKSTIIKLLCRLYKPSSGEILVNGININHLSKSELKNVYGIIFQDYCNYSLTLRENVAFGDIKKLNDDKEIKKALKMGMSDDIRQNLDDHLGKLENEGVDLSGGQWQRIAISRACISDSEFIILDEPTASLDPLAECEMYTTFSKMLENKGCIMISHRLASAKMTDKIVVLNNGKVEEIGSHNQLLETNGLYIQMWTAQSDWYKEG